MAPLWQKFLRPASLGDALQALSSAPGRACPIAGGTDLLLDLRQGHTSPMHTLVDVSAIPELTLLEEQGDGLRIGAALPISQIIQSQLILHHAQALAEACDLIGGPQVRNVATLGGNVAHALPAADGAIALLALDAYAGVASLASMQDVHIMKVPLLDLYAGPGITALKTDQLLVYFHIPLAGDGQGSAFARVMCAQGVALPVLNLAVWLKREHETVADLRIAVGPAGPVPRRAHAAEDALRGHPLNSENLAAAEAALLAETHFRTSPQRATAEYRRHLAGNLLVQALYKAWERAA